jgi:hypothetical protein
MYLVYVIDEIHYLFNKSKKVNHLLKKKPVKISYFQDVVKEMMHILFAFTIFMENFESKKQNKFVIFLLLLVKTCQLKLK